MGSGRSVGDGDAPGYEALILVRHSLPAFDPAASPSARSLSDDGRWRCGALADRLRRYHPDVIVTSREPKAVETGQFVAERLGCPCELADGLHEYDRRRNAPWLDNAAFDARVADLFARLAELLFGAETANETHQRFAAAITVVSEPLLVVIRFLSQWKDSKLAWLKAGGTMRERHVGEMIEW